MVVKFWMVSFFVCITVFVSAQERQLELSQGKGYKIRFKDNCTENVFVSVGAGMGVLFADQDNKAAFKDRLNTNPHLAFGKWLNSYLGLRTYFTGGVLHGFVVSPSHGRLDMQHNKYFATHLDFLYDLTTYLGGYDENRFFRFIPWIGIGYGHRFQNQWFKRSNTPSLNAGLLTAFRLHEKVDFTIELQGMLLNENFNRVRMGKSVDGILQLSAGLAFRFGKSGFKVKEPIRNELIEDLNKGINILHTEKENVDAPVESYTEYNEGPYSEIINYDGENIIYFSLASSTVDEEQEIKISQVADFQKETGVKIKVIGYADDKKTGSSLYNMNLSEKRAREVAKILMEKYDVSSYKIIVDWKGSDDSLNPDKVYRLVLITVVN